MNNSIYKYDVALSFAGEDRSFAEQVAAILKESKIKVFYDKYEEVNLWGKDLYSHLSNIYQNEAKYCIMFISKFYAEKLWTNHERRSAQARAFIEKQEYILPIRLDNTPIEGILPTIGHIDGTKKTPSEIANLIINKLNELGIKIISNNNTIDDEYLIPEIKRKISDLEKKKFLNKSFTDIQDYFENALIKLKSKYPNVDTELNKLSSIKFVAEIYVDGELKIQCKLWIGGMWGTNSISYSESTRGLDINNDNSMNDSATVEDNGKDIYFKILGTFFGNMGDMKIDIAKASGKDAAKYFWERFIQHLNY